MDHEIRSLSSTPVSTQEITLAEYLFQRLNQVGCNTVFGLPGDFNLKLIDKIGNVPNMKWCGNANELNASYAADGYARIRKIGVICTTFGVGEMSSLNGIAGSFAEHVGVLHVVGTPTISTQLKKLLVHHTLGNGDFNVFHRIYSEITSYHVMLQDIDLAPLEIDKCIVSCILNQKPCYLGFPANLSDITVPKNLLNIPLNFSSPISINKIETERDIIQSIISLIMSSKNPIILADGTCNRHDNIFKSIHDLIRLTKFPVFVTPMGKGSIDEQYPRFGGVYVGSMSSPEVKEFVENSDLILAIGSILSDFSTSSFHYSYKTKNVVEFHIDYVKIKNARFPDLNVKSILSKLLSSLNTLIKDGKFKYNASKKLVPQPPKSKSNLLETSVLRQEWIWDQLTNWLREGDIIIAETGTSAFGIMQTRFPNHCLGISQVLWGASGYSLGACLGALFAQRDDLEVDKLRKYKRCIVFIGDGSLQFTVQEVSTMLKWNFHPYIFVMNNHGYTIDRILHDSTVHEPTYHDVHPWNLQGLLTLFGGVVEPEEDQLNTENQALSKALNGPIYNPQNNTIKWPTTPVGPNCKNYRVELVGEFSKMVNNPAFSVPDKLRLIEVILPTMDAPNNLIRHVRTMQQKKGSVCSSTASTPATTSTVNSTIHSSSHNNGML